MSLQNLVRSRFGVGVDGDGDDIATLAMKVHAVQRISLGAGVPCFGSSSCKSSL